MESNFVKINGVIESELKFNNTQLGENFYATTISVMRDSGFKDYIPVLISDRLMNVRENHCGEYVSVTGQFRSYNKHEEDKKKLLLYVFAREFEFINKTKKEDVNYIEILGYICKQPVYRKTPLGREIADLLIAVNRPYGKSDYIPCICWGRNARFASGFEVGVCCRIIGRIQSREYTKRTDNEETEIRTAYEISVSQLIVEDQSGGKICV